MRPLIATASAALLLIAPFDKELLAPSSCLSSVFYGTYRSAWNTTQSIFLPSMACLESFTSNEIAKDAHITQITRPFEERRLVWIEKVVVEPSLGGGVSYDFFKQLDGIMASIQQDNHQQEVLAPVQAYEVLYQTSDALLLSVPRAEAFSIDLVLPRFWKSTLLPVSPVSYIPVPPEAIERVKRVLAALRFDPVVASVANNISIPQMKHDVMFLTGEDHKSGILSRHSFSSGALIAAQWIKETIGNTGANCRMEFFLEGFAPNVICRYDSVVQTNSTIIFAAHYDSRGSFGRTRAPGADDDGSGTAAILGLARTIGRKGVKFHSNVELCAFAGEEQGRLGSKAYARQLRVAGTQVDLMVQADMLAYRALDEPLQLGLPESISTPEATQLVANISNIYSRELQVGLTAACCSDHQSFLEEGFPSTQVFERAGPIADPMYHNSGDLSGREGYSFEQLYGIAKVQLATLLHTAGFEL